jgi:hypothetical protein
MNKVIYFLVFSVLFLFGCSTEEVQITDSQNPGLNQVSLKGVSNAPEQSGMYIIRIESGFAVYAVDFESGISASFGADNVAYCNGDPDYFDFVTDQIISVPSDELKGILLTQGEVYTEVFDGIFTGGEFCAFVLNTPILAQGMTKFVSTDNDLFTSGNNNTNSWGTRGHGLLLNQDNETTIFWAYQHFTYNKKQDRFNASGYLRLQNVE